MPEWSEDSRRAEMKSHTKFHWTENNNDTSSITAQIRGVRRAEEGVRQILSAINAGGQRRSR